MVKYQSIVQDLVQFPAPETAYGAATSARKPRLNALSLMSSGLTLGLGGLDYDLNRILYLSLEFIEDRLL